MCNGFKLFFSVNIESAGALRPEVIFIEAVRVLKNKCRLFIEELDRV